MFDAVDDPSGPHSGGGDAHFSVHDVPGDRDGVSNDGLDLSAASFESLLSQGEPPRNLQGISTLGNPRQQAVVRHSVRRLC